MQEIAQIRDGERKVAKPVVRREEIYQGKLITKYSEIGELDEEYSLGFSLYLPSLSPRK